MIQVKLRDDVREYEAGITPGEIAKSMAFKLKDDSVIIVVFMGTARIDNRKFKDRFHCKATMLTAEETPLLTGHPVGGVCPFGVPENVTVYLDESLKKYEAVYPAATSSAFLCEPPPDESPSQPKRP